MRSVFRCVASRNRGRSALQPGLTGEKASRRQRCFAEKSPALECRAAPSPARGGFGSRDLWSRLLYFLTNYKPFSEKFGRRPPEALRAWAQRPRDAKHRDWFSPKLGSL